MTVDGEGVGGSIVPLLTNIILILLDLAFGETGASEQIQVTELRLLKFFLPVRDSPESNQIHNLGIRS